MTYPATRTSLGTSFDGATWREGFIKLYLGHSAAGSVLVPAQIFCETGEWSFFQPSFFGPCRLGFNVEPGRHVAELTVDVASPRSNEPVRLLVETFSDQRVKTYEDGAQLYRCRIAGPADIRPYVGGVCRQMNNGDFSLTLHHHTNPDACVSINTAQELWSSTWNLQGTRKLRNVSYVYFTSLPSITSEEDLVHIAMASTGRIRFQTTSDRTVEEVLELPVYRESTTGRTATIVVRVPSEVIAPPHLLLHPLVRGNPAYYEIVGPEIYRVGVNPGARLSIAGGEAKVIRVDLKTFEYIVVGPAAELTGLAAPYDEEETKNVMHLERLSGTDLFDFWQANANTDQISHRVPERRTLEPST